MTRGAAAQQKPTGTPSTSTQKTAAICYTVAQPDLSPVRVETCPASTEPSTSPPKLVQCTPKASSPMSLPGCRMQALLVVLWSFIKPTEEDQESLVQMSPWCESTKPDWVTGLVLDCPEVKCGSFKVPCKDPRLSTCLWWTSTLWRGVTTFTCCPSNLAAWSPALMQTSWVISTH